MSKYTKRSKFEIEFEGDTITGSMTRLKRKDYLKLVPFIDTDNVDDKGEVIMSTKMQLEFMDVATDLLPKYIVTFTGLTDAEGDSIDFKDVVGEVYFMDVMSDLVDQLFTDSNLKDPTPVEDADGKEDAIKNSDEPFEEHF